MSAQLWEWDVDGEGGSAPAGVCGTRDRAVEALSRSLAQTGDSASGRVVPVALAGKIISRWIVRLQSRHFRWSRKGGNWRRLTGGS